MQMMDSKKVTLDDQVFLDRLREGIPPEVEEGDSLEQLREFSQWLLVVPLIMLIIFGCGQLALFTTTAAALAESPSSLVAEYGRRCVAVLGDVKDTIRPEGQVSSVV